MIRAAVLRFLVPLLVVTAGAGCAARAAEGVTEVVVRIHHSRFVPSSFEFQRGQTVRFVVINEDPIDHEFLIGDRASQRRHEKGTEAHHGARPGEISIPANSTRSTTYTFASSGTLLVGCHLPSHYAYGMRGTITIH